MVASKENGPFAKRRCPSSAEDAMLACIWESALMVGTVKCNIFRALPMLEINLSFFGCFWMSCNHSPRKFSYL